MAYSYDEIMTKAKAVAASPRLFPKPPASPALPKKPVAAHARALPAKRLGPLADRIQQEQKLGLFRRRNGYVGD